MHLSIGFWELKSKIKFKHFQCDTSLKRNRVFEVKLINWVENDVEAV